MFSVPYNFKRVEEPIFPKQKRKKEKKRKKIRDEKEEYERFIMPFFFFLFCMDVFII
jgi:hypothetical protein